MYIKRPEVNYNGGEWAKIRAFLTEQLSQLRIENDKISKDATATAAHRGRIEQIKLILNWETRQSDEVGGQ